jgi:PPP family 3-phenylpropionic acid transporter
MESEGDIEADDHDSTRQVATASWRRSSRHVRAGYFWYYAAIGAFTPFTALYYRDLGFSGLQIGVLTALPSLGMALFGPFWGALSDSLAIHRLILRLALVLAAVLAFAASYVSEFASLFPLIAVLSFAVVPVAPLLDSYGVTVSERLGRSYGELRVWGSLGFMLSVLVVGRLMDERVSSLVLVAYAACLGLTFLSVVTIPHLAERHPRSLLGGLKDITHNRPLMLLLLIAYLLSSGGAVMYIFLGIRLQEIGGSANLVGVAFALSAVSELPVVAFGGWFLSRFGASRLIAVALCVYVVRFTAFSTISEPEWMLPVQVLHGLSFGAFLMASVTLAHRLAGNAHAATAQSLLTAMSFGFGSITGSIAGGALLDHIGTVGLFRGAALLMLITLAVLVIGDRSVGLDRHEQDGGEVVTSPVGERQAMPRPPSSP